MTRPPYMCMAPSGEPFELDRRSAQSDAGWKVTGSFNDGTLTCAPSFVLTHWHSFLQGGFLLSDVDGRDSTTHYNEYVQKMNHERPVDVPPETYLQRMHKE